MIKIVAKFLVRSEKIEEFKNITEDLIEKTREEAGNISYELYQDIDNSQVLTFIEEWKDQNALDKHMEKEYLKNALSEFEKIVTAEPEINKYNLVK